MKDALSVQKCPNSRTMQADRVSDSSLKLDAKPAIVDYAGTMRSHLAMQAYTPILEAFHARSPSLPLSDPYNNTPYLSHDAGVLYKTPLKHAPLSYPAHQFISNARVPQAWVRSVTSRHRGALR